MTTVDEDELRALRARAYGPSADIHRDPEALDRLKALELAVRPPPPVVEDEPIEATAEPAPQRPAEPEDEPAEPLTHKAARLAAVGVGWLRGLRRSTVLIALGVVALATVLAVTLEVVQRVQTDPLQAGAEQVARLGLDAGYELPRVFAFGVDEAGGPQAYESFYGLRAIVSDDAGWAGDADGECLSIFSEDVLTDLESDSFSGPVFGGCSAGSFPAMTQFSSAQSDLPERLLEAFPDATGLQFVYDRATNEVVVFAAP